MEDGDNSDYKSDILGLFYSFAFCRRQLMTGTCSRLISMSLVIYCSLSAFPSFLPTALPAAVSLLLFDRVRVQAIVKAPNDVRRFESITHFVRCLLGN